MDGIIQHVVFSNRLVHLTCSQSLSILYHESVVHPFLLPDNMDILHILCFHTLVDEHLGCFHFSAVMNNAAANINVKVFEQTYTLIYFVLIMKKTRL